MFRSHRSGFYLCILVSTLLFVSPMGLRLLQSHCHGSTGEEKELRLSPPRVMIEGISSRCSISAGTIAPGDSAFFTLSVKHRDSGRLLHEYQGILYPFGSTSVDIEGIAGSGSLILRLAVEDDEIEREVRVIPGFLSILPPLIAILFSLIFREVIISLTFGIWLGALFLFDYSPFRALLGVVDYFAAQVLQDRDHVLIIMFTLFLGGIVGVITKSGGMRGVVEKISRFADSSRKGQIATWLIGLLIFFDDYANCLIVGNTMRPISDKLRISREKLAYIVDATAAPVSSIALISTWIGFEVGLIGDGLTKYGIAGDPYLIFLQTIPYRFYPILSIIMILIIIKQNRDLGSMFTAEQRARTSGAVLRPGSVPITDTSSEAMQPDENTPIRWSNAAVPIIFMVLGTFSGLYIDGYRTMASREPLLLANASTNEILAYADSFKVLLWTSFLGVIIAIAMAVSQKIMTLKNSLNAMVNGMRAMMMAMIILVLAWSIGSVCKELETAHYIVDVCSGVITPSLLPFLTFVMSALISFSTGSSWATMAILIPIIIPVAHQVGLDQSIVENGQLHTMVTSLSSILAGSVFGDHCSPISDTTIMSSMAAGVDHIDHVRTQLPYALSVAVVGTLTGDIPSGYGVSPWLSLLIGAALLFAIVRFAGKQHTQ